MTLGKRVRLSRLFAHPSGRFCSVAVDHFIGYQAGLPEGLRDLPETLRAVVAGRPDAVTMHKGVAKGCWGPHAGQVPLIVQSTIARPDDSARENIATPAEALRLGADAFATCAFVRGPSEAWYLRAVADFVRQADGLGMPLILHVYPLRRDDGGVRICLEAEHIAWAVRCGIETGADVIKVPFTGDADSYGQIVRGCPVPVVAAGGPRTERLEDALALAAGVVASGARGMTIGRNVWGFAPPARSLRAFQAVIHDGAAPGEALKLAGG